MYGNHRCICGSFSAFFSLFLYFHLSFRVPHSYIKTCTKTWNNTLWCQQFSIWALIISLSILSHDYRNVNSIHKLYPKQHIGKQVFWWCKQMTIDPIENRHLIWNEWFPRTPFVLFLQRFIIKSPISTTILNLDDDLATEKQIQKKTRSMCSRISLTG